MNSKKKTGTKEKLHLKNQQMEQERTKKMEDKKWVESDEKVNKRLNKKSQRKDDEASALERKRLNKEAKNAILADEDAQITKEMTRKSKKPVTPKVTRAQMMARALASQVVKPEAPKNPRVKEQPKTLEDNLNRERGIDDIEATGVEGALKALSVDQSKTTYIEYEARQLPMMKEEFPSLKLSQLKHMCRERWNKSPENPRRV
eukprot:TRINITY_DN9998_c0_g1_i1.p1 TRINITY_DN9998_c0_g1~~TRINITY_DN9998_c0_g1_i1.p1  ORF type:complete len:203 (+),score=59.78 TRINITY_DN9998_c0_g1_i1:138-746(+)